MQRDLAFNVILLQFKYFFPNLLDNFALEDFSVWSFCYFVSVCPVTKLYIEDPSLNFLIL